MAHPTLELMRELTSLTVQRTIAAAKAEALVEAAADHPTLASQLRREAMVYACRAGNLQPAQPGVTEVSAVSYAEDAVDSDVALSRGCVSGSNREVAPFGLDWTKLGWFPATGRGASGGPTPNPSPPSGSTPPVGDELGSCRRYALQESSASAPGTRGVSR